VAAAYHDCRKVFMRGYSLLGLHDILHAVHTKVPSLLPGDANISDLVRSAVVLCVSAMDAYYSRRFLEIFVPFVKKHGVNQALHDLLTDAGLDATQAIEIATMKRPLRRVRTLVRRHLERRTPRNSRSLTVCSCASV
jgi:hypothetical protein